MSRDVKQVIVVRKDLHMRAGKIAAQAAHASMKFLFDRNKSDRIDRLDVRFDHVEALWLSTGTKKIVVYVNSEDELRDVMMHAEMRGLTCHDVTDAGHTEFKGMPTLTCCAIGPGYEEDVNVITGKLKLL